MFHPMRGRRRMRGRGSGRGSLLLWSMVAAEASAPVGKSRLCMSNLSDVSANLQSLPYATPVVGASRQGPRVWAAVCIMLGGLGLVGLGGCFLIGVLSMIVNLAGNGLPMQRVSGAGEILMGVLYLMAAICFIGAGVVIVVGIRGLLHVIRTP